MQTLRRGFKIIAMKDNEHVNDYFVRILEIMNKMIAHGERLNEVTLY